MKIGDVYICTVPNVHPNFTITRIEGGVVYAKHIDDVEDWELNLNCIKNGYFRKLTKLDKALQ